MENKRGKSVECPHCGGAGLVSVWSFGVKEPEECSLCDGSGINWLYPNGAIARYYSGPMIGRMPTHPTAGDER